MSTSSPGAAQSVLVQLDHPLVRDKLSLLRDRNTDVPTFRRVARELSLLVAYEATRGLPVEEREVETPLERTTGARVSSSTIAWVPVLRAGLGMLDAALDLVPGASVGFVGVYREEEELRPVPYYLNLPSDVEGRDTFLLDPMVATGGSASYSITVCKEAGARSVTVLALIAAPEGAARVHADHPDVAIYAAAVDRGLNEVGYILPGLGDAGDRLFATE
jgi:uracil phosphoribosyltransferase